MALKEPLVVLVKKEKKDHMDLQDLQVPWEQLDLGEKEAEKVLQVPLV